MFSSPIKRGYYFTTNINALLIYCATGDYIMAGRKKTKDPIAALESQIAKLTAELNKAKSKKQAADAKVSKALQGKVAKAKSKLSSSRADNLLP